MSRTKSVFTQYYGTFSVTLENHGELAIDLDDIGMWFNNHELGELISDECATRGIDVSYYTQNGHTDWCRLAFDNFTELLVGCLGFFFE